MAIVSFYEGVNDGTQPYNWKLTKKGSQALDVNEFECLPAVGINIGDEVKYYDYNSVLLFTGLCIKIETNVFKRITVYDYAVQSQNIIINKIYTNESPEAIIQDVISNTDMTYSSTISSGLTIAKYIAKDKRGWDIILDMCSVLQAEFYADKNKVFHLETIGEYTCSQNITNTTATIDNNWIEDGDNLVNSVTILGDKQIFEATEIFSGTGAQTTFTTTNKLIDVVVEYPVGTIVQGYVDGSNTGVYQVKKEDKQIVFDTAPAVGVNNIKVRYTYAVNIKLTANNASSISSYGIVQKKYEAPYIKSYQEARKYANFILSRLSEPLLSSTWIIKDYSLFESFMPNMYISVNDSIRGIVGNYLINSVERTAGIIKVKIGQETDLIYDWQKEAQDRIKQLEEKDDNSTTLQFYESINENIEIQLTTSISMQTRTLPDNYMYFGDANDSPVYANIGDGTERPFRDSTGSPTQPYFYISDGVDWEARKAPFPYGYLLTEGLDLLTTETGDLIILE